MIAVIDYGAGNLRSVHKALTHVGASVQRVTRPEQIAPADALALACPQPQRRLGHGHVPRDVRDGRRGDHEQGRSRGDRLFFVHQQFRDGDARASVGLPLLRAFIKAGFGTIGYDIDQAKVDQLLQGQSYIAHIPSDWITDWLAARQFTATADMKRLQEADALLICVPTPLNESRDPDLSCIESTARHIAAALRPGQLVVLESTTYPGTTREVVLPILATSGLTVGEDYFLAFSPEREDPGNPDFVIEPYDQIMNSFLPEARIAGFSEQLIYKLLHTNPWNAYSR